MTKINQTNQTVEPQENTFISKKENRAFKPKNYSRRWIYTLPDLIKTCFICDVKFAVKYNLPKKKYSHKNNWGYWTGKPTDQKKNICNTCLVKILNGKKYAVNDWVDSLEKAGHFYTYLSRGSFPKS